MKNNILKISFALLSTIIFSFCMKENTKEVNNISKTSTNNIKERGKCCGDAVLTNISSAYDYQIMYLTSSGWQTTGCISKNITSVTVGGCCPDGSVLVVVAVPCGGTAPANFSSGQFSAVINNTYNMVYLNVTFSTAIPGYPNLWWYYHYEVPIC